MGKSIMMFLVNNNYNPNIGDKHKMRMKNNILAKLEYTAVIFVSIRH